MSPKQSFKQSLKPFEEWVKQKISPRRYEHTRGVLQKAITMAGLYDCDEYSAALAALCHDAAKGFPDTEMLMIAKEAAIQIDPAEYYKPNLLHGPVAAIKCARELGITDQDVLNAIRFHTTGRPGMSILEQIIYLADLIEAGRDYPGVDELRALSEVNLQAALKAAFKQTLKFVMEHDEPIHPMTVLALNWLITNQQ